MKTGDVIFIKNGRYMGETTKVVAVTEAHVKVRINNIDIFVAKEDAEVRARLLKAAVCA